MDANVKALLALRELDQKIGGLRRKVESKPAAIQSQQREVAKAEAELAEVRDKLKVLQTIVDRRNVEVSAAEEVVKRLDAQLQTLKTNEEYQTMQRQIEAKKAGISELEDKVLEGMEVVETAKSGLPPKEKQLAEKKASLAEAEKRVAAEVKEHEAELAALGAEWKEKASVIDDSTLTDYKRILARFPAKAMVEVTPEGHCAGCHTRVTSQIANEAMAGHLVYCNNCERFLYMPY